MMSKDGRSFTGMVQNQKILAASIAIFFIGMLLIPAGTVIPRVDRLVRALADSAYLMGFAISIFSFGLITEKLKHVGILAVACGLGTVVIAYLAHATSIFLYFGGAGIEGGGMICLVAARGQSLKEKRERKWKSQEFPSTRSVFRAAKAFGCMAIILLAADSMPCVHAISRAPATTTYPSRLTMNGTTVEFLSPTELRVYMNSTYDLGFSDTSVTCNGTTVNLPKSEPQPPSMRSCGSGETFWWDSLQFCYGQHIKYYHADRDYYGISPYVQWNAAGAKLQHTQLDEQTSMSLGASMVFVVALIALAIAGPAGPLVAGVIAAVLLLVIAVTGEFILYDEVYCIWFEFGTAYAAWVLATAAAIIALYFVAPELAVGMAITIFLSLGYIRIGNTTFYDAIGAGNPSPPPPSPNGGGQIPPVRRWFRGGSRTCMPK